MKLKTRLSSFSVRREFRRELGTKSRPTLSIFGYGFAMQIQIQRDINGISKKP
jgi:hypothetical protein